MNSTKSSRIFACFLVLVVSFFPVLTSSAAQNLDPDDPPTLPDFAANTVAFAFLTEVNGATFVLIPVLVEAVQVSNDSVYVTFEVGIPEEYLGVSSALPDANNTVSLIPTIARADSEIHNKCDSTASVCARVTLYYTQIGDHGWYQSMSNRWTRSDSTVTWSNAKLDAGCAAEWYSGSGRCNAHHVKSIGVPTSGTTYSHTPSFAGSSNQVLLDGFNGISAGQTITLRRGSTTWTFAFCVAHEGDQIILGCY